MVGLGQNHVGQAGGKVATHEHTPVLLMNGVAKIEAASYSSFFVMTDGRVLGSGGNSSNHILDTGSGDWRYVSPVTAWNGATDVSAANSQAIVLSQDGQLLGRGQNSVGQLGFGAPNQIDDQTQIATNVRQASTSGIHTVWVTTDGILRGIGSNFSGQLGTGQSGTNGQVHNTVVIMTDVAKGVAGGSMTLILKNDGSLWGTGRNTYGQLGLGHQDSVSTPTRITDGVVDVVAGSGSVLFLKTDGSLWGMGNNSWGQLGMAAATSQSTPIQIASSVVAFDLESTFTLYVDDQNRAWGLGWNGSGQLGTGDAEDREGPVLIMSEVQDISASSNHSLFLKTDGSVWGAGYTASGQLLREPDPTVTVPQRSLGQVRLLAAGNHSTLALRTDGSLWAAGDRNIETLTNGIFNREGAFQVATGVTQMATSGSHSVFVKQDGSLWIKGDLWFGQSGMVPYPPLPRPSQIATGVKQAATAASNTLFVDQQGQLWASGYNQLGQLGVGHANLVHVRQMVATAVAAVAAGSSHSLFIKQDGGLWGMGQNGSGALGTGTGTESYTPVFITHNVTATACGSNNTYFITRDGQLMGLGRNDQGQLGTNPVGTHQATPVFIASDVVAMAAGNEHVTWIDRQGTLWGSGRADDGQLGLPVVDHVTTPRRIAERAITVAAGHSHTVFAQVPETYLTNLSTRVSLTPDGSDLVAGFVISGTEPMEVLVRAVGPTLADYGVEEPLANPSFRIFDSQAEVVDSNDDWGSNDPDNLRNVAQALGAFTLPEGSADAATIVTLNPGAYTVRVERPAGTGGTVLLELYKRDVDQWRSRLMNLSVRNDTGSGEDTMIAGFATAGSQDTALLVRAVGPTLADYGVTGTLADPRLSVFAGITKLQENDDWANDETLAQTAGLIGAFPLPETSRDAAMIIRLTPGAYTAQVSGSNTSDTGQALVEVYAVDE